MYQTRKILSPSRSSSSMMRKKKRYRFLTRQKKSVTHSQCRFRLRNARFTSTLGTKIHLRTQM